MKNSEYWAKRFEQLEDAQNKTGVKALTEIQRAYTRAERDISDNIRAWYQRFADNNEITLSDAKKWITGNALKEFKWDVKEYIRKGEENALTGEWMKELENASAKVHISKYEALQIKLRESLEEMSAKYEQTMDDTTSEVYRTNYYHTAYEIQKGIGIGYDIAGLDQSAIEKILSKPWAADGYNFSERIWKNKNALIDNLYKELTHGIMLGKDPQKTIDAISKQMNVSKNVAGRLVMTESAYFGSVARKDCFNDLGVEQYVIVATLDNRTSEICRELDGKVYKMSEYNPGVTAPPFHVYCRSTTAPYFEDMQGIGDRAARDEVTGKTYDVPKDMTYKEWKKQYVIDNAKDIAIKQSEMQYYKPVQTDEGTEKEIVRPDTTVTVKKLMGTDIEMWMSAGAKLKPKQLNRIEKNVINAAKAAGMTDIPPVVIVSEIEMGSNALASYNPVSNTLFTVSQAGDKARLLALQEGLANEKNELSTFTHELLHKSDADWYKKKYGPIDTEEKLNAYISTVRKRAATKIEKLSKKEYDNLIKNSKYAEKKIGMGEYEEAYIEMRLLSLLR